MTVCNTARKQESRPRSCGELGWPVVFTEEFRPKKKWEHRSSKTRNEFIQKLHWNSVTNRETRDKTLKVFKRCLAKFDTDKMNFEPILATTKNRDFGYKYVKQFLIVICFQYSLFFLQLLYARPHQQCWSSFRVKIKFLSYLKETPENKKPFHGFFLRLTWTSQGKSANSAGKNNHGGYCHICAEGYGFQAAYSRIGYMNQSIWV